MQDCFFVETCLTIESRASMAQFSRVELGLTLFAKLNLPRVEFGGQVFNVVVHKTVGNLEQWCRNLIFTNLLYFERQVDL